MKVRNSEEEQSGKKLREVLSCPEQSARLEAIPARESRQLREAGLAMHADRPSARVNSAIEELTQPMQELSVIFTVLESIVMKYTSAESGVVPSYKA